jgi:hypothetical protein
MAEAVLVDTAASIAESLGSLALQEIELLWGLMWYFVDQNINNKLPLAIERIP